MNDVNISVKSSRDFPIGRQYDHNAYRLVFDLAYDDYYLRMQFDSTTYEDIPLGTSHVFPITSTYTQNAGRFVCHLVRKNETGDLIESGPEFGLIIERSFGEGDGVIEVVPPNFESAYDEMVATTDEIKADLAAGKFKGDKGDDGYTPIKGVDYYTDEDIKNMEEDVSSGAVGTFSEVVKEKTAEAKAEIEKKGQEVIESIPEDYTELTELVDKINLTKANVDGFYEDMSVGTAENLIDVNNSGSEQYFTTQESGGGNIETGNALIKTINGNTIVYNQLVSDTNDNTVQGNSVTVEDATDNNLVNEVIYGASHQDSYTGYQLLHDINAQQSRGIKSKINSNGSYTLSGTATEGGYGGGLYNSSLKLSAGSYTVSINKSISRPLVITNNSYARLAYMYAGYTSSNFNLDEDIEGIRFYLDVAEGNTINDTFFLQLESGSTAHNWEPYVGGKASPSPDYPQEIEVVNSETITTKNEDESESSTATLSKTLNAIPVSSGGNVTINGQQYISDYIDIKNKKIVRVCERTRAYINGSTAGEFDVTNGYSVYGMLYRMYDSSPVYQKYNIGYIMCNTLKTALANDSTLTNVIYATGSTMVINYYGCHSVDEVFNKSKENGGLDIIIVRATPTEESLTDSEIADFLALKSYKGTTNFIVTTDDLDTVADITYKGTTYPISTISSHNYLHRTYDDSTGTRVYSESVKTGVSSITVNSDENGTGDNLTDLTRMGCTSADELYEYYPLMNTNRVYNQGQLVSYKGTGVKATGKNLLPKSEFVNTTSSVANIMLTFENPIILPKGTYYISSINRSEQGNTNFVDINGNYLEELHIGWGDGNDKKTTTKTYIISMVRADVDANTTCYMQLQTGSLATNYETYTESTKTFPVTTIQDHDGNILFPNGLLSAGSVHDEITDSYAIKRVGYVKMGDLVSPAEEKQPSYVRSGYCWTYDSSQVPKDIKFASSNASFGNITVSKMYAGTNTDVLNATSHKPYIIGLGASTIRFQYDSEDADEVTNFIKDQYLCYELAEPITVTFDDSETGSKNITSLLNLSYKVTSGGLEIMQPEVTTVVPEYAPMSCTTAYSKNYVEVLNNLDINHLNSYSLGNLLTAINSATGKTITGTQDSSGNWTFTVA